MKPYQASALGYFDSGWFPIPLAGPKGKTPLVHGWHGGNPFPDRAQVAEWVKEYPGANVGLRLPKGILGIDVDCYDGKKGAETIAAAEEQWGKLPPAWISTARDDGSGIRLFRVPDEMDWPGQLGDGVELIHWANRFVVAAPSLHKGIGRRYRWVAPDGHDSTDRFPDAGEI